jgi:hypothetical protein
MNLVGIRRLEIDYQEALTSKPNLPYNQKYYHRPYG